MSESVTIAQNEQQKKVLVVDQERLGSIITKMLVREHYVADLAVDGLKALSKLRTLKPEIIVADAHVPGGGIKLAELVGISPRYQKVPVILTSSKPTPDMIIRARNAGCSSYLAKPFRPSELTRRIEMALSAPPLPPIPDPLQEFVETSTVLGKGIDEGEPAEKEEDSEQTSLLNRVKALEGLPAFPATHAEILKLAKSEDTSSEDLAEKLQLDPGLLATIFKLVNSSYYGFNKQVKDLKLAVTLLGLEEIANLVLAVQVFQNLGKYKDGAGLDLQAFWRHSVGTAFVAKAVARKLNSEVESAFLSGMLHDLGKVILDAFFKDYYAGVFEAIQTKNISIIQAESEVLGLTHCSVGGALAEEWKFPSNYMNAILYHHSPRSAPRYQRLACIIHLADVICRQLDFGSGGDSLEASPEPSALELFGLKERGMELLVETAEKELENAGSFLAALSA